MFTEVLRDKGNKQTRKLFSVDGRHLRPLVFAAKGTASFGQFESGIELFDD
jgi:hypothetical protein